MGFQVGLLNTDVKTRCYSEHFQVFVIGRPCINLKKKKVRAPKCYERLPCTVSLARELQQIIPF